MKEKICGVYKITNNLNGMSYIGQSIDCWDRWVIHKRPSTNRTPIDKTINEFGKENFTFKIEKECSPEELDHYERETIKKYNTLWPNGYNYQGGGKDGFTMHEETRKTRIGEKNPSKRLEVRRKISESLKGDKNPNHKKICPESTRRKISEANKGKHNCSEEMRKKLSESAKNRLKPKYLTPSGEIREMNPACVSHWHKDWIRIEE